jgi:hypothetical protein
MPSLSLVIPPSSSILQSNPRLLSTSDLLRREPQAIISDAPMTPPLSPARSELAVDTIVVDSELHLNAPERDLRDAAVDIRTQIAEMEVDRSKPSDNVSQGPLRLLEDEHVHLQKSGLRLSDFDVRGTLGQCCVLCWLTPFFSCFIYQVLGRSGKYCLFDIARLLQNQAPIITLQ